MLALLQAADLEAVVVCPGGSALETRLRRDGIAHRALEFGKVSLRRNPLWHFSLFRNLTSILKSERPDAVIINLDGNTPLVTIAVSRLSIPLVRFCRFEFMPPRRRLDRWCWLRADAVICPSKVVQDQFRKWLPRDARVAVHQIYDSCVDQRAPESGIAAFRRKLDLTGRHVVGCVGRLHPDKRIETAVRAHSRVLKKIPDAQLLIIGGAGSAHEIGYETALRALVDELELSASVTFAGALPRSDMPAAFGAMDVCILPSSTESFGMVLAESWKQGVPTVASDVGGCHEISIASGGGLLAPVDSDESFASQVLRLLLDRPAAARMGQCGAAWVTANCDPASSSKRLYSIISDVIAARTRRSPEQRT